MNLEQNKWNIEQVLQQLSLTFQTKREEEERKENMVLTIFNEIPALEYDQALALMKKHNYNLQSARVEASHLFKITVYFQILSPQNQPVEVI